MNNAIRNMAKVNYLNSQDFSHANNFTRIETKAKCLNSTGITVFDYYSNDDLKYIPEWTLGDVNYRINQYGFRFDEMLDEVDIAVFGCSFTFGTGLALHQLWHDILAKELNMTCLNFGIAGASIKTIADVFKIVSSNIKIKRAIFLLPNLFRTQIAKKDPEEDTVNFLSAIPGHRSILCEYYQISNEDIFRHVPEEERYKVARDELYNVEYVGKTRNIDTYFGTWDPDTGEFIESMNFEHATMLPRWYTPVNLVNDKARDKMHPGIGHHKFWANEIKPFIK